MNNYSKYNWTKLSDQNQRVAGWIKEDLIHEACEQLTSACYLFYFIFKDFIYLFGRERESVSWGWGGAEGEE